MSTFSERDAIRREHAAFLMEHGVTPSNPREAALSPEERRKVESIAKQIVFSGFDKNIIAGLDRSLLSEVSMIVYQIMSSRLPNPVRDLEEVNPYYRPFTTQIIRDSD